MLVLMIIICVLIGLAYADYCLIDNTAHFGICYMQIADTELEPEVDGTAAELGPDAEDTWDDEREVVVPPAVGVIDIAAARSEQSEQSRGPFPRRRPGFKSRNATISPVPSADAGVAAIGT